MVRRVVELETLGFGWAAINATAIFQTGARGIDTMIDTLSTLHAAIRRAVGARS